MNGAILREKITAIGHERGLQAAYNRLLQAEVALGKRVPSLAIYDHTWHMIGGGQKYGFTIAHALQEIFDITLIANHPVTRQNILDWYHLDLFACQIKIIPLAFFAAFDTKHLDPARVTVRTENPFDVIARESGNYDFFINNSMNEKVFPLANVSALVCHFPERRPKDYFYADRYTYTIYNSIYTAGWIEKKWKFTPHKHIYPPVDMAPTESETNKTNQKENIILSVARFEEGGSKKQMEMVQTFLKLKRRFPVVMKGWRLVLAGGCAQGETNTYLGTIADKIKKSATNDIELLVNCSGDKLKEIYGKARLFWHLCGLDHRDPAMVEHFGMTIVEAMQNGVVPIVYDGGGQREIVEQGVSGFRALSTAEVMNFTLTLIRDEPLWAQMSLKTKERSGLFSRENFEKNVKEFFTAELLKYTAQDQRDSLI